VFGSLLSFALRAATGWSLPIDMQVVGSALAISALTCAICSLLPALRASQVMPARTLAE
jgi:ABC-type antimicrobial peptide transport system permease subunit